MRPKFQTFRLLGGAIALMLCLGSARAQIPSYADLLGAPRANPIAQESLFRDQVESLFNARLAACPIERATTYYVDPDTGDNGASGLSPQDAWRSLSPVRALLAQRPADVAILFKSGSIFRTTATISILSDDITLATYGGDEPATISGAFPLAELGAGTWTHEGGRLYSVGLDLEPHWVMTGAPRWRHASGDSELPLVPAEAAGDRYSHPYAEASSLNDVATREGSFWWDAAAKRLYLHTWDGQGAPGVDFTLDGARATSHGVYVFGDRCRLDNLVVEGQGLSKVNASGIGYNIFIQAPKSETVVSRCVAMYNAIHGVVHAAPGAGPASATLIDCVSGLGGRASNSTWTSYVTFAQDGGQEMIARNCWTWGGELSHPGLRRTGGQHILSHSGFGNPPTGLLIWWGGGVHDHPVRPCPAFGADGTRIEDPFDPATYEAVAIDVKATRRGENSLDDEGRRAGLMLPQHFVVIGDSTFDVSVAAPVANGAFQTQSHGGNLIMANATIRLEIASSANIHNLSNASWMISATSDTAFRMAFSHCRFEYVTNHPAHEPRLNRIKDANRAAAQDLRFYNCVIDTKGPGRAVHQVANQAPSDAKMIPSPRLGGSSFCAFGPGVVENDSGASFGYDQTLEPMLLEDLTPRDGRPATSDPLTRAAGPAPPNITPELDATGRSRPDASSIGPLEAVTPDVDGDGFVGSRDLSLMLANWGMSGRDAIDYDMDGDGIIGSRDLVLLLTQWN